MLLIDNSAFARLASPGLPDARRREVVELMRARGIAVCLPFLLEAGYSARGGAEHAQLMDELTALPRLPLTPTIEDAAVRAQEELARVGHHRLPPVDVIVAAIADGHGAGVLHYDGDYDLLAGKTSLRFESVWLTDRGSL